MNPQKDIHIVETDLYFLPVKTRVPLKFGSETLTEVTCARVRLQVHGEGGRSAEGWGETPLNVQWVWPSHLPYHTRLERLSAFCRILSRSWAEFHVTGHALEIGYDFQANVLPQLLREFHRTQPAEEQAMPWLAALVCCSPFDIALHDAYGKFHDREVYQTYNAEFMNRSLDDFLEADPDSEYSFEGKYPADFLVTKRPNRLRAWHLVGGLDCLTEADRTGDEVEDGFPVVLTDWIRADGLKCLKIKLRGNDAEWDYRRVVAVGRIARESGVDWLSADFNCTVNDPAYVNEMLDRLHLDHAAIFDRILYVEQPFAYDLESHRIDVRSITQRKPVFLDESAHDWRQIQLGRHLGWNGVALKTCKTQTGAILSACWARTHKMSLMVQDLTNPMLAQISHALLAAHVGTIMGVETNSMQFYPRASEYEAAIHPGLYRRRGGNLDLSTISGPGFGYREAEIQRPLPEPVARVVAPRLMHPGDE